MKNKRLYLLLLLAYLFTLEAFAQVPTLLWEKGYGTTGFDYLMDFQAIPGGYIYCGNSGAANYDATVHHGLEDVWLIGADTAGNILWQKSFGGALTDGSYAIEKTTDGGYIVVGLSHSSNGDVDSICQGQSDVWILKTDSLGNLQWQKSYGGSYRDYLNDVKQTSDGGYVVVGTANSSDGDVVGSHGGGDCWLLKLSSTGVIQWQKSIGSDSDDDGIGIEKTSDGGYIVLGCSAANNGDISGNHGAHDYWIIKLDDLGNLQWEKSYGGSANDLARSFSKTSDGGYIITGYTESNDGDITTLNKGYSDIWIVKIDSLGVIQWQKSYGGSGYDDPTSISQTSDGGYIFSASSSSNNGDVIPTQWYNGDWDYWIVKIDNLGAIQWQKSYGGTNADQPMMIKEMSNNSYIIVGISKSNNGNVTGNHGNWDGWAMQIKGPLITATDDQVLNEKLSMYPNPAKAGDKITLPFTAEIEIYDLMGKAIYRGYGNSFEIQDSWNQGLYLILINNKKTFFSSKLKIE